MAVVLLCSKCRTKLQAEDGCIFCEDFKNKYLAIEGDNEEEALKLTGIGASTIKMLSRHLVQLEELSMQENVYNPSHAAETVKLSKAVASTMEAVRKLRESEHADDEEVTYTEQLNIFVEWLQELPTMLRKQALKKVAEQCGTVEEENASVQ